MSALWKREWYVIIDNLRVDGLRIQFKATKTLTPDPNTLDLKVYNLAAGTRAQMQKKGVPVIVVAGYAGDSQVVFSGDARSVDHTRDRADWVTHVQCGDGENAYAGAHIAFSFAPGTSVIDMLKHVVSQFPVANKDALAALSRGDFKLAYQMLQQGYAAQGRTVRELDRALRAHGIEWSVQDGMLQLLQGRNPTKEPAVLLSPSTGLIGSPDHGAPEKPNTPQYLKMQSLLQPGIRPGRAIRLESVSLKGDYRAEKVQHEGDSHGSAWTTSIEALPL